jgi:hypothetical protein
MYPYMAGKPGTRQPQILGWIGVACIAFVSLGLRVPPSIENFGRVLDLLGPILWVIVLAGIVLPALAAPRGSKWWLAMVAAGVFTFCVWVVATLA